MGGSPRVPGVLTAWAPSLILTSVLTPPISPHKDHLAPLGPIRVKGELLTIPQARPSPPPAPFPCSLHACSPVLSPPSASASASDLCLLPGSGSSPSASSLQVPMAPFCPHLPKSLLKEQSMRTKLPGFILALQCCVTMGKSPKAQCLRFPTFRMQIIMW